MKRHALFLWLSVFLATVALAVLSAPAEVLADLDFFSDLEMLSSLEILEDEDSGASIIISTAPLLSTAAVTVSGLTVKISTSAGRSYEKR